MHTTASTTTDDDQIMIISVQVKPNKSIKWQTLPKQFQNQKVNRNQWDDIVFKDRENNGLIIC